MLRTVAPLGYGPADAGHDSHGQADAVLTARQAVLTAAHAAHPEQFVRQSPRPLALPREVCINPPADGPEPRILQLPRDIIFIPQLSQTG